MKTLYIVELVMVCLEIQVKGSEERLVRAVYASETGQEIQTKETAEAK